MASASAAPGRLATRAPRRRRDALPVPDTRAAAHAPSRGAAAVEVPATADRQHRRADLGSPRCPSRHLRQDLGDLGHGVQEGRQPHRASSEGAEVDGTDGRRCRLTPGSSVLRLASGSDRAVFVGDLLHSPVQILDPCCNSNACLDQEQAVASRRRILGRAADERELLVPAHFGGAGALEVRRDRAEFVLGPWAAASPKRSASATE